MLPEGLHLLSPGFLGALDVAQLGAQVPELLIGLEMTDSNLIYDCDGLFDESSCRC